MRQFTHNSRQLSGFEWGQGKSFLLFLPVMRSVMMMYCSIKSGLLTLEELSVAMGPRIRFWLATSSPLID